MTEKADAKVKGLFVRELASGRKRYVVRYSFAGKQRKLTLGPVELMSLADARSKALEILSSAHAGENPSGAKTPTTFGELAAEYLERKERLVRAGQRSASTVAHYRQHLNDYILSAIGHMQAVDIRPRDINNVVDSNDLRGTN